MNATKRTRLSPDDRRMQLLDCARTTILDRGLSSFTVEGLARDAGVSIPLVYRYFETRLGVLQELLKRESRVFSTRLQQQVIAAADYRELVRLVVAGNFEQFSSNNIINILRDQPDVYEAIAARETKEGSALGKFLVRTLSEQYQIESKQAQQLVVLASGASQAAAAHFNRFGGDQAAMIDATVEFIFGGIDSLLP
jgi:AcrR family transcriptional regulator